MIDNPEAPWTFIIDTEQYAGNFERQMAAWITGMIGGCGVGEEMARQANRQLPGTTQKWFAKHLSKNRGDSDDGYEPFVSIVPTPGWFNDGFGNHWRKDANTKEVQALFWKAARSEMQRELASTKGKKWQDRIRTKYARWRKRGPDKWPACLSVGIFFDAKPSQVILDIMGDRAASFNQVANDQKWHVGVIAVTKCRLVERKVVLTETEYEV